MFKTDLFTQTGDAARGAAWRGEYLKYFIFMINSDQSDICFHFDIKESFSVHQCQKKPLNLL